MDNKTFNSLSEVLLNRCRGVLTTKAAEYAVDEIGNTDRLHNFRQAALLQGTTPKKALGGMMAKHTISIYDLIGGSADGIDDPETLEALWDEKIVDSINYLILLNAMVKEDLS